MLKTTRTEVLRAQNARLRADSRKMSGRLDEMEAQLARVATPPDIETRNELAAARRRAEGIYPALGLEASDPIIGESSLAYRKRLAAGLKQFSPDAKNIALDSIDKASFGIIENTIYTDALAASRTGSAAPVGVLRSHTRQDRGREITEYHGDNAVWMRPFMGVGARIKVNRHPEK